MVTIPTVVSCVLGTFQSQISYQFWSEKTNLNDFQVIRLDQFTSVFASDHFVFTQTYSSCQFSHHDFPIYTDLDNGTIQDHRDNVRHLTRQDRVI